MDTSSKIISEIEVEEEVEEVVKAKEVVKANDNMDANQIKMFDFAVSTYKRMKELEIITITQSPEEMQLSTKEGIYKLTTHVINNNNIFKFNKFNEGLLSSMSSKKLTLTGPAMKMGQLLHRLFIHLHKLPIPAPTMNLSKFDKPELYN